MSTISRREKTGKDDNSYKIRLSQLITVYGPGAIIDFVDQPLMVADVSTWKDSCTNIIHDERLEKKLKVDCFRIPKDESENAKDGIPFVRFPKWYYCPNCKKFKPIEEWEKDFKHNPLNKTDFMLKPRCSNSECKGCYLVAPSILVACEKGHIDDFPWVEWVHLNEGKICKNPELEIVSGSSSLGLESFKVKCKCGAMNSLEGAFRKDGFEKIKKLDKNLFKCKGSLQWKGVSNSRCDLYPSAILRNASNIYFPKIETSLVIPPYSYELNSLIEESEKYKSLQDSIEIEKEAGDIDEFITKRLKMYVEKIAQEIDREEEIDVINSIINRKIRTNENEDEEKSRNEYRFEEYNALMGNINPDDFNTKDFKIERKDGKEYKIKEIASITLVKRLREVRALIGFTRLNPPNNYIMGNELDKDKSNIVSVKPDKKNWYPAYEVRGEGIFIEISSKHIDEWITKNPEVVERTNVLNKRYNKDKSGDEIRNISTKFVMLHTLAHLLIKELSFECGYSITSLRERLYCDLPGEENTMNGILIYTADSDSEGSLGGLVKQGRKDRFTKIFINAIKRAMWCSYDPVCINSGGQGRQSQNLAACHSCTLLPETSCEEFNVLLDRALIIGTLENRNLGFLNYIIENKK